MSGRFWKTAGGTALAVVVAYTGASWYLGYQAQERLRSWVADFNEIVQARWSAPGPAPVVQIESYDRGVFSSRIRYVFQYTDHEGKQQILSLRDDLAHGPWPGAALRDHVWVPMAAYSRLTPLPSKPWQAWLDAMPDGQSPWEIRSRIAFSGKVASDWRFEPVKVADSGLDFSGGQIVIHYDPQSRHGDFSGAFSHFLVDEGQGGRMSVEGISLEGRNTFSGESGMQAHQRATFDVLRIRDAEAPEILYQNFDFSVDSARTGDLMDSKAQYSLGDVKVGELDLGQVEATVSASHLNVPGLQALAQAFSDARADDTISNEEETQLGGLLQPVLAAGPRLALETFRWSNTKGTSELSAAAEFQPDAQQAPSTMSEVLERGVRRLDFHVDLSKPMILQMLRAGGPNGDSLAGLFSMMFDQFTDRFVRIGLVKREDANVRSDLTYMDGTVDMNGRQLTVQQFLALLNGLDVGLFPH